MKRHCILSALAALLAGGVLWADGLGFSGAPKQISFKPIDTSKVLQNHGLSSNISLQNANTYTPKTTSTSSLFRPITLGSWPPTVPTVFQLPQKQNVFQPTLPKGTNYFANPSKVISTPGKAILPGTK